MALGIFGTASEMLSGLKVRMRWILLQHNLKGPVHITGDSARRWVKAHGHLLDSLAFFSFSQLLDTVEHIELQQLTIRRPILSSAFPNHNLRLKQEIFRHPLLIPFDPAQEYLASSFSYSQGLAYCGKAGPDQS